MNWIFIEPVLYTALILLPFLPIFNRPLFSKKTLHYDDTIIIFMDIEPANDFENMYYDDKVVDVACALENDNDLVDYFKIFGSLKLDSYEFDEYLYNLRDYIDHCQYNLKKKVYILLNTTQYQYEMFFDDYDIQKVINVKRLYGYFHPESKEIPNISSLQVILKIISKTFDDNMGDHSDHMNKIVEIFEEW